MSSGAESSGKGPPSSQLRGDFPGSRVTEMHVGLIRFEDRQAGPVFERYVYGLGILSANRVRVPPEAKPCFIFAQAMVQARPCAAVAGVWALEGDTPEEAFGPAEEAGWIPVTFGPYQELFCRYPEAGGCFFPRLDPGLVTARAPTFEYLVRCDALALLVEPSDAVVGLLNSGPHALPSVPDRADAEWSTEDWLPELTAACRLLVLTAYDGYILRLGARRAEDLEIASGAVARAADAIQRPDWYREHRSLLTWDEREYCLRLPRDVLPPG